MENNLRQYLGYVPSVSGTSDVNCENLLGPVMPESYIRRAGDYDLGLARFCRPIKELESCLVTLQSQNRIPVVRRAVASEPLFPSQNPEDYNFWGTSNGREH